MASVIHKELECKGEKLKYMKLEVMPPGIKNIFHLVNKQPSWLREERGAYQLSSPEKWGGGGGLILLG